MTPNENNLDGSVTQASVEESTLRRWGQSVWILHFSDLDLCQASSQQLSKLLPCSIALGVVFPVFHGGILSRA